jgi:hypothetical protein
MSLNFSPNQLWLKDFYLAKISKDLTKLSKPQGIV